MNERRYKRQMIYAAAAYVVAAIFLSSCVSTSDLSILGTPDQTAEAAKIIEAANDDLNKVKVLYIENEQLRPQLAEALKTNNAAEVRRISEAVIKLIADGSDFGRSAITKIGEARDMAINDKYDEYLMLKQEGLKRHLEAFEKYRLAAVSLRDNYDPKNIAVREKVTAEFTTRSQQYREITERARSYSSQANELYMESFQNEGK